MNNEFKVRLKSFTLQVIKVGKCVSAMKILEPLLAFDTKPGPWNRWGRKMELIRERRGRYERWMIDICDLGVI